MSVALPGFGVVAEITRESPDGSVSGASIRQQIQILGVEHGHRHDERGDGMERVGRINGRGGGRAGAVGELAVGVKKTEFEPENALGDDVIVVVTVAGCRVDPLDQSISLDHLPVARLEPVIGVAVGEGGCPAAGAG